MAQAEKLRLHKEKVYRYVKDNVITHAFRPGDILRERALAETLGVSRTPVREAIQALQDDGWLKVMPRKGTMVRALKRVDIEEIMQLRTLIGCAGIMHGIRNVGPGHIAYFETLIARQEEAAGKKDAAAYLQHDLDLHLEFVKLANNRRLLEFATDLCDYFKRMGAESLRRSERYDEATDEHKRIVAALAKGDALAATALLEEHLVKTRTVLLDQLGEE